MKDFAAAVVTELKQLYIDELHDAVHGAIFMSPSHNTPKRKYVAGRSFASNPWFTGRPVVP